MKKIILLGYMGWKSTIAKALSKTIRFRLLIWIYIEKSGIIDKCYFEMKGEIKFRKMEHEAFVELMLLGCNYWSWGGTPCYANNHELLKGKDVLSIYLRHQLIPYSIDWLLIKAKTLLASKSDAEMKEFIAVHLLKEVLLQSGSIKLWMVKLSTDSFDITAILA
jgi:shikimate kinase